jgi:plasmid stabilization system protein ParE
MKYASVTSQQAEADLHEIGTYLNGQRENLGLVFLQKYQNELAHLCRFPASYRVKRKGFREVQIGRFKILLIYKFHSDKVWIHRLVHAARRPGRRYH